MNDEPIAVPDRFSLTRELGAGGMGRVFEVFDRELEVPVALEIRRAPLPRGDDRSGGRDAG